MPTPTYTPIAPTAPGTFNPRDQGGLLNSTYGELGGIYGAVVPWTYGGQRRGFVSRTTTVGAFTPRPS